MTLGKDLIGPEAGWIPLIVILVIAAVATAVTRGKLGYIRTAASEGFVQGPSAVSFGSTSAI